MITKCEIARWILSGMNEFLGTRTAGAEPRVATVERAAELLGIGRTTIFGLIANGTLRSLKIGSRRLIPLQAIDEFIERRIPRG